MNRIVLTGAGYYVGIWTELLSATLLGINSLLTISSWDEDIAWIADNEELVADSYFFSKECVQVYTMQMVKAATAQGFRMNSVCPSPADTRLIPAFRETMTDQIIDWAIETGAGRVASAEDQARAFLFLGSDLASYFTGVNLLVDGGYTSTLQMWQFAPPGGTIPGKSLATPRLRQPRGASGGKDR